MTGRTLEIASDLMSPLGSSNGLGINDWVVRCIEFCCSASENNVIQIVNLWKNYCEINIPSLHIFTAEKVLVVSVTTGI